MNDRWKTNDQRQGNVKSQYFCTLALGHTRAWPATAMPGLIEANWRALKLCHGRAWLATIVIVSAGSKINFWLYIFPFYLLPTRVLILSPIRIPWMLCFLWLYKGHPSLVKSSSLALYTFLHINKVISFIFYCVLSLVLFSLCLLFIVRTWVVHHHLWVMESNP
jgi:hypothetical protein